MSGLQRDCLGWRADGLGAITSALHPFNPTTFKQLSLPIRIVVHVIIVILFSKTSPLSVTLPPVGRRHVLHFLFLQPGAISPTREDVNQL